MKQLLKVVESPSGWDSLANYAGDLPEPHWLCLLTRTRDSDELGESNFACALEQLGGESDDVQVFRYGHWACGWWEALCVREGTEKCETAQQMHDALQDYPVLDEDDFSRREQESADMVWRDFPAKERFEYVRTHRSQFEFHDFADMLNCMRGKYFSGYASELIH